MVNVLVNHLFGWCCTVVGLAAVFVLYFLHILTYCFTFLHNSAFLLFLHAVVSVESL